MGVMCKISVNRPASGVFRPGYEVTGVIKFAVDEITAFKDIVIKLVGSGYCHWRETKTTSDDHTESDTYTGNEKYVSVKNSILSASGDGREFPIGSYENRFAFVLPDNIPSSYEDSHCTIKYQIVVKFHRPGLFRFAKEFTTDIQVLEYARKEVPPGPIIYGLEKKLLNWFSSKKNIYLKAEIEKSILAPGETTNLKFSIKNDTKVIIPSIEVSLCRENTYTADCGLTKRDCIKPEPIINTASIPDRAAANLSAVYPIGKEHLTINNSKIFSRNYKLCVTIKLPLPHLNASVDLPIVIGELQPALEEATEAKEMVREDPPSYWETMQDGEGKS